MICALILPLISAAPDAGQQCLDAWFERLKTAKTISGVLQVKGGGADDQATFLLARPNFACITGDDVSVYSDGKESITYVKSDNMYVKKKAGRRWPDISMTAFGMESIAGRESNFVYKSYKEVDDALVLTMKHKPGVVTILGRTGISGEYEMTWTFDKTEKILRSFSLDGPDGKISGEYRLIKFNEEIPKEAFSYTLPAGAEPYDNPDLDKDLLTVGDKAPDLTLKTTTGETVKLSEFVKKNKLTLVNFWFFGCGGCMIEFPNIDRLNRKYSNQGFRVIGIDPMDDLKTAADHMRDGAYSFPSLVSKGTDVDPDQMYKVEAYPTNYLIGPDMKIIDRFTGEDEDRVLDAMEKAGIKLEETAR